MFHFWAYPGSRAILAKSVANEFKSRNPLWLVQYAESVAFILLCWITFLVRKDVSRLQRALARDRTNEYRAFVTGLRALRVPPLGETIFFDSLPSLFDQQHLQTATQVALGRRDVHAS